MSREIKFRGKLHDEDRWVYGYYAKTVVNDGIPFCLEDCRIHNIIIENGTMWFAIPETVGEYTGLRDCKGQEVYEGDIVETVYDGILRIYVVVFDLEELGFKATNGKENYGNNFQYLTCCEEVTIIGNIHDSPELLKGGIPNE